MFLLSRVVAFLVTTSLCLNALSTSSVVIYMIALRFLSLSFVGECNLLVFDNTDF